MHLPPRARLFGALSALGLLSLAGPIAAASAAPPPNDLPQFAGAFAPYTAENGVPQDQQAIAELAEATAEPGAPRCLGSTSFARTVWFVVPATETFQEITVEASGRTLELVDLAAFVQPEGAVGPTLGEPNACSGEGATGAEAAEEPTSAVTLRVPARRAVLIQVGRRGARGLPEDERAVLSLETTPSFFAAGPLGDVADRGAPSARTRTASRIALGGSTLTEEDPAQPACPSLGSVWRRIVPRTAGSRLISVRGVGVSTLAVFSGTRPTGTNALDCVNRAGFGQLQMRVRTRPRRPLWIRIGSDRPADDAEGTLLVEAGDGEVVIDGGSGGFDPTTGGPGGGLPLACTRSDLRRALIGGPRIRGTARERNRRRTISLRVAARRSPVCDVEAALRGPRGRIYAEGRMVWLRGRRVVRLARTRSLVKGVYRLEVSARSELGEREPVRTRVKGRLR